MKLYYSLFSLFFGIFLFSSCNKEDLKSSNNQSGLANSGNTNTQGCSMSQGYWFASPVAVWPSSGLEVGGHTYTEAEAKVIWNTSNQTGLPDSKKCFTQVVAIKLSSSTIGSAATVWNDVSVAEGYLYGLNKLTPSYLPTGNTSASTSAGAIGTWINNNHCN